MTSRKIVFVLALALAGVFAAESALAGGRTRVSVGIGIGVPVGYGYGWGGYGYRYGGWGYPYYGYGYGYPYAPYYAAPVVVQQQPTVYVEQAHPQVQEVQTQQPSGYWYYCNDSRAYYPYVRECPAGWQRVAPQPQ